VNNRLSIRYMKTRRLTGRYVAPAEDGRMKTSPIGGQRDRRLDGKGNLAGMGRRAGVAGLEADWKRTSELHEVGTAEMISEYGFFNCKKETKVPAVSCQCLHRTQNGKETGKCLRGGWILPRLRRGQWDGKMTDLHLA
jgi:hypothetical protein